LNKTLLLFDLDGTLLVTHGAGVRAMVRAGRRVFGDHFSLDGVLISGGLDPDLVRRAARLAGEVEPRAHERFQELYAVELSRELETCEPRAQALPGVHALLTALRQRRDVTLGLLTGNYRRTGALKLSCVGIGLDWFALHVWGDQAPTRPALVAHAVRESCGVTPDRVIVIGDTPRDVECAKANGCRCLAVATGGYAHDDLVQTGADVVAADLSDPSVLLAMMASSQ
jgi:phosphoglycolate phosphatase-like HAD superfamily hydrolase